MKVVVPVTINDTNMTSDAVDETYPEWGVLETSATLVAGNTNPAGVWENPNTLDLYMSSSYPPTGNPTVYRKLNGATFFSAWKTISGVDSVNVRCGDAELGYVYLIAKTGTDYFIYSIALGTGDVTLVHSASVGEVVRSLVCDTAAHTLYFYEETGNTIHYLENGDTSFSDLGTAPTNPLTSIGVLSSDHTLYALADGTTEIEIHWKGPEDTPFSEFSTITTTDTGSLLIDQETSEMYVVTPYGAIYKNTSSAPTVFEDVSSAFGSFDDLIAISEAHGGLFSDSFSGLYLRGQNKLFQKDDYCISDSTIYISLVDDNIAETSDSTKWFRHSAVNHLNMFDGASSTPTTGVGELNLTIDNSNMTAMGFFGVVAESITVALTVDAVEVFSETKTLRNTGISDWYDYFFEPINQIRTVVFTDIPAYTTGVFSVTISGSGETDPVECALCVAGFSYDIGRTKRNVRPRIVSYSTQTIDNFGRVTFVRRNSAKRIEGDAFVEDRSDFERVFSLMDQIRDTPCMWIVSRDFDAWSILYGLHQKFEPVVTNNNGTYSFELLEVFG